MEVAPRYTTLTLFTLFTLLKLLYTAFTTEACMSIVRKGLEPFWMWLMIV